MSDSYHATGARRVTVATGEGVAHGGGPRAGS